MALQVEEGFVLCCLLCFLRYPDLRFPGLIRRRPDPIRVLPCETDRRQCYTVKISKRFLNFLGSEPSKTKEKHLLPNPEFSSVLSGIKNETNPDPGTLDKLSQYIGYKNFADFSRTFVKREEEANKTTVKISVDHDEESLTEKLSKIIINITNEQHFKIPEFIKKNGLGIMEMALLLVFVTGGVVFPNTKSNSQSTESSFTLPFIGKSHQDKKYMYWNGERYIVTDSSYISPSYKVIAANENELGHFRKITRKDTMTVENSLGKVWCSKWNNEVDFFTMDAQYEPVKIAFLSDVHFQDLYGSFSDNDFKGIINPKTGKPTILRTMDAQLHSTRIFNENYFAFLKALDDIAQKGIKIVAMPGDFSDDGQAYNLRGLHKILDKYHDQYGIEFYMTTGNHDPVGPFRQDSGKDDFLGQDGFPLGIYSKENIEPNRKIITKDIAESGYLEILDELKDFGFYPKKENVFWSTPFTEYSYQDYSYKKAWQNADYSRRMYNVSEGFPVPDLSYVVEPVKGIWLMAIDGNTYIPKNTSGSPENPENYKEASVGYNNVLTHKKHLIEWVKRTMAEAKKNDKTVIAFTHYPMVDFNDGATPELKSLLGEKKWQMERVPEEEVAKAFAETGLQIHFAGHMHINDTGIRNFNGRMLVNIQVPSLAAYIPAYKILIIHSWDKMEVRTEVLDDVPRFNELFPLYEKE
uniref:Calcineurin-like phosphoesterase domain-containing protein n=1 Tax=Solanum lycopersicum TaxID=4081 RepID=A0A494G910_SOLLC